MKELFNRLFHQPAIAVLTFVATFFIAVLNLGSPIFVINVLNRYVNYGFDGTLVTLTFGMMIVIFLQYGFRIARVRMIGSLSMAPDAEIHAGFLDSLTRTKAGVIDHMHSARIREMAKNLNTVQAAHEPSNLTAIMDAPFSLLYIAAVLFLSPLLAFVALLGIIAMAVSGFLSIYQTKKTQDAIANLSMAHQSIVSSVIQGSDTVRVFNGRAFLENIFSNQIRKLTWLRFRLAGSKEQSQSFTLSANSLMSVILYAVGSFLVVRGEITVGALIGANILASRSYMSIVRLVQTGYLLSMAGNILKELSAFSNLPAENEKGTAIHDYKGKLEFRDISFTYQGSTGPLFESLNLTIEPGTILIITGKNGTGKTTLARLLTGLLSPTRGEILVGGINLTQIALPWWRKQVVYFPQEPVFLNASIRDNLKLINTDISEEELNLVIRAADLRPFLDRTPGGLDTVLAEGGRYLPLGIRRRIALARALVSEGHVVVFDEPTEGLDTDGIKAVYSILNNMSKSGKTIIVMSHDPNIVKAGGYILDLNIKPVAGISMRRSEIANRKGKNEASEIRSQER
ncbi:MAG: ATP-binding cassette domain-containing protein [Proteobacteria bacterium]|nr:ATP-binding cassette domain-containing protein [Pseudomonadota bacterium]